MVIALDCSPELDPRTLLLKTPHEGHGEIKLMVIRKLSACQLAFIGPGGRHQQSYSAVNPVKRKND